MLRLALAVLLLSGPREARADVDTALQTLAKATGSDARLAAAHAVVALGPSAQAGLTGQLTHPRGSTDAERRAVLRGIGAVMPDKSGVFSQPPRPPKGGPPPEPDGLVELARLEGQDPALVESIETVVLIRALAATRTVAGAAAILDFAFSADGMAFRDECGRNLRAMSPYSLPALLRASAEKQKHKGSWARYASYQLDRLDKSRPSYALAAARAGDLEVAMLQAIGDVRHPDAVAAVLERCDSPSHAVRKAAREAWMALSVTRSPSPSRPMRLSAGTS
jgi:hypothetical protein